MFARETYITRRAVLKRSVGSGLLLFLGNEESPMNFAANAFPFRQDSTFLYFWGIDHPGLAAVLDIDDGTETLFGDDPTVADVVWTGPQPLLRDKAESVGAGRTTGAAKLQEVVAAAVRQGRRVHYLPPYRAQNVLKIERLLGIHPSFAKQYASVEFIKAVVAQRSYKTPQEIEEIEKAVNITREMQLYAMRTTRAGMIEREVVSGVHAIPLAHGGYVSFPIILTIHGETLHNLKPDHAMKDGDIVINDCGAETANRYAADLTRTYPVSGKFTERQKEVYRAILDSQQKALDAIKPGVAHRDIHLLACRTLAAGLKAIGLMRGNVDEAVAAGAHAMFLPCGLGHMMGLDVHDMEDLGEQYVGYAGLERNPQFGLCYLRLAKPLEPGFVITCEPGVYIIPELIDQWKSERRYEAFLNYEMLEKYRGFGGMRVEDDVVITQDGYRLLGAPLAKTIEEVEAACER